ncbi:abortive infection family protein [Sphingomonas trueperi]|uniref:abortive infection family protein n=1 Tax=Sphingomonas trueperi TaxID=53317 RepID=UPI000EAE25AE
MTRTDVNNLRTRIAEVVAGNKAYDVPAICARLGLAPGTEDEAMRSKLRYVNSRLNSVPTARLVKIAQELLEQDGDFWLAEHVAKVAEQGTPPVSVLTRRRIFDAFEGEPLCTEYDQLDFIEQIWPVAAMPSAFADTDVWGHRSLKDDIVQHTIRNDDWTNRELLERLGLLDASKALLFRFLEAAVHPTAIDENGQKDRVERINRHLQHDGYRLSRTGRISGCPVYTVNAAAIGSPADATISNTLAKFEPEQVHARWTAALDRRSDDPAGAITLARTLLEDVCRWLLDDLDIPAADQDDLPALYRKLSKGLKLAPDDHSEQVFKQILGNCQSIVESLGALRNKLGDAHGGGPKRARPAARHAELAVNLAGSMATFLVATWDTRRKTPTGTAVDD